MTLNFTGRIKKEADNFFCLQILVPCSIFPVVVTSEYDVDVFKETVIRGNDALLKCQIPSFVSDLVFVEGWVDSQGNEIRANQVDRASLGKRNPENIRN